MLIKQAHHRHLQLLYLFSYCTTLWGQGWWWWYFFNLFASHTFSKRCFYDLYITTCIIQYLPFLFFTTQYFISKAHHDGKTEFEKWIALRPMAVCYLLVKHYEHLGQHQQSGWTFCDFTIKSLHLCFTNTIQQVHIYISNTYCPSQSVTIMSALPYCFQPIWRYNEQIAKVFVSQEIKFSFWLWAQAYEFMKL